MPIRKSQLEHTALVRTEDDDWALLVSMRKAQPRREIDHGIPDALLYAGPEALRAASKLLPALNARGARAGEVQSAVQLVTEAGDPGRIFRRYAAAARPFNPPQNEGWLPNNEGWRPATLDKAHLIARLPKEVRLALEMASHEEQERRALEGELALLEAAWREAEEVAQIADDMFLPEDAARRLESFRKEG